MGVQGVVFFVYGISFVKHKVIVVQLQIRQSENKKDNGYSSIGIGSLNLRQHTVHTIRAQKIFSIENVVLNYEH